MNTSTFKEVFTASIKVHVSPSTKIYLLFYLHVLYLFSEEISTIDVPVYKMYVVYQWIFFTLNIKCFALFQYLVERIHTNYALQVRITVN